MCVCGAVDSTQGLMHVKQALYELVYFPSLVFLIIIIIFKNYLSFVQCLVCITEEGTRSNYTWL